MATKKKVVNNRVAPIKKRFEDTLIKMRMMAKNSSGGDAKTFWLGYDQACYELQRKFYPFTF